MNQLWDGILQLRKAIEQQSSDFDYCFLNYRTGTVLINQQPLASNEFIRIILGKKAPNTVNEVPTIFIEDYIQLHFFNTEDIAQDILLFLRKYVLLPFLIKKAKAEKRAISIAHLAQTLDGKIATSKGFSKWIGNKENLIHAHRMRALCDGVLVGSQTLKEDQPKLTVRHVKGTDPIRIVLGNPEPNFDSLINNGDTPILTLYHKAIATHPKVQYFKFESDNHLISTEEVLTFLYKAGIYTVYIEGGAKTISCFFENSSIDILQLHIAPIIFGSGKSGLQFPQVQLMEDAFNFRHHHYLPVADAIMFTGFK